MKKLILAITIGLATQSISNVAFAQNACQQLDQALSVAQQCQAREQALKSELNQLRNRENELLNMINDPNRERQLRDCEYDLRRNEDLARDLYVEHDRKKRMLDDMEMETLRIENRLDHSTVGYECAIMEKKYSNSSIGQGRTLGEAQRAALESPIKDLIRKHGHYMFCFRVFR